MSDTVPHSYSLATHASEKSRFFNLGCFLIVGSFVCQGVSFRVNDAGTLSLLGSSYLIMLSLGLFLMRPRRYLVCSKCGSEVVGQPLLCRTCRCKCLAETARSAAPAKYAWMPLVLLPFSLLCVGISITLLVRTSIALLMRSSSD